MFLQEATPDTSGYMIAGYAIAFIIMALYVLSIYLRSRNLHQDLTLLDEIEKQSEPVKKKSVRQPQSAAVKPARRNTARK